ncbi:MAG: hypothetical protein JSV71_04385 [Nitrospiraceae bacterium]|nr:MAG: hypothetical protein JSV71_04385 [Nitrospiraceae bacterium]
MKEELDNITILNKTVFVNTQKIFPVCNYPGGMEIDIFKNNKNNLQRDEDILLIITGGKADQIPSYGILYL